MVITPQRHHVFQVWQDLYVINAVLVPIIATALGPVLPCLLLMNGLPTLIPKTRPKTDLRTNPKNSPTQTSYPQLLPNALTLQTPILTSDRPNLWTKKFLPKKTTDQPNLTQNQPTFPRQKRLEISKSDIFLINQVHPVPNWLNSYWVKICI